MLPWCPLLLLLIQRKIWYADPRRRFLLWWALFGLVLFSASANKLPGYVLPLLPALAALAALGLDELADARIWLAACAGLLIAFPIAAPLLPAAVANEWSAAPQPAFDWTWMMPLVPLAAVWILESRGQRLAAMLVVTAATAIGVTYLKVRCEPEMERIATARALARQVAAHPGAVCLAAIKRDQEYGLEYYAGTPLPSCQANPLEFRVLQVPGEPPKVVSEGRGSGTATPPPTVDPR
jgi:4-amino-4-deoxy-L-arabinose transferase-like glycosyltransferase